MRSQLKRKKQILDLMVNGGSSLFLISIEMKEKGRILMTMKIATLGPPFHFLGPKLLHLHVINPSPAVPFLCLLERYKEDGTCGIPVLRGGWTLDRRLSSPFLY